MANGTIIETKDDIFLKAPTSFNAAPVSIRERLLPLIYRHLNMQSKWQKAMTRLEFLTSKLVT